MDYTSYNRAASSAWGLAMYADLAKTVLERTGISTGRLVDLGSGPGHMGLALADLGHFNEIWFVDPSPEALRLAQRNAEARGRAARARYLTGNAAQLRFPDGYADLVVSRGSLQLWTDHAGALAEIRRVLSPSGRAYIGDGHGSAAFQDRRERLDPSYPAEEEPAGDVLLPWTDRRWDSDDYADLLALTQCDFDVYTDSGQWLLFDRGTA